MSDEIRNLYENLCDFIHENNIKQIIGEGSSATPYLRLVKKAYQQRYGKNARELNLVSTGILPKFAQHGIYYDDIHKDIARHIAKYRPALKKAPSLLLSEFSYSGDHLRKLSGALKLLEIPHKTAIMNHIYIPGVDFIGNISDQSLLYLNLGAQYDFIDKTNPNNTELRDLDLVGLDPAQVRIKKPKYIKRGVTGRIEGRNPRAAYSNRITNIITEHRSAVEKVREK